MTEKRHARYAPMAPSKEYLCGPVPLDWLQSALAISYPAFCVATLLWHLEKLHGAPRRVPLQRLAEYGMAKRTAQRAIVDLEQGGLIHCERQRGRIPLIACLSLPRPNTGAA